jgi:predicted DNA-binding transcriptional regulator AlpA
MSESALEAKLDALLDLYDDLPKSPPKSDYEIIKERIQSGGGFTSIKELCRYHDVCVATIYNWIAKGAIPPPIKIGGLVKFKNSDLLAMEQS